MPRLLLSLLLLLVTTSATAGDWRVIPIRMYLGPQVKSESVRLINNASEPLNLQLQATVWTQNEQGEDIYEPTDDIIYFPRVLSIPPGKEGLLRASYKFPAIKAEKTYRLFIEEIPAAGTAQQSAVMVAVRFGLPIFVAPPQPQKAARKADIRLEKGAFSATIANTGNSHLLPSKITLSGKNAKGETLFTQPLKAWYILTGNQRTFSHTLTAEQCTGTSTLQFDFYSDALHLSEELPVTSNCRP